MQRTYLSRVVLNVLRNLVYAINIALLKKKYIVNGSIFKDISSHPRFRTVLIDPCYLMAIDYDRSGQSIAYKLGQCLDTRRRPTTTDRADPR